MPQPTIPVYTMFMTYVRSAREDGIRVDVSAIADELEDMGYSQKDVINAVTAYTITENQAS